MASLSDILSALQNGVVAINNFGIQLKTTLTRISTRFGNYLLLSGGTLTGDLTISKATPILNLNKAASGQHAGAFGYTNILTRWFVSLGNNTAEGGANSGSDFSIYRYTDAGAFIAEALGIARATGNVTVTGDLSWTGAAWTVYTPVITASGGVITTKSATGRYKTMGKTVFVEMIITITTNGTGSGSIIATLPATASAFPFILAGRENNVTGKMLQGLINAGSSTVSVFNYDNTYPAADGYSLIVSGMYEAA